MSRVPPYVPSRSDSVTSNQVSATRNSDGYPYSVAAALPTVVWTCTFS